ncbi:PREDICTED: putative nuclease HARBI1 [Bactrocera latifrons]|uniref:putative nuclease HARBI1 n=1 Tax=Bactrocera latifrons TaxID=174628 RepID=UPI0008DCC54B|nr:PREDICTED: putative nuclease HARBI1 [Bactrocera latifrons]
MIICDYNMTMRATDARRPGSSHDALIWSVSRAQEYFQRNYEGGERGCWLLSDAGYALQPYLLTPFRDPSVATPQHTFNQIHSSARNIIERSMGVLKSRFRCLSRLFSMPPTTVYMPHNWAILSSVAVNVCLLNGPPPVAIASELLWATFFLIKDFQSIQT